MRGRDGIRWVDYELTGDSGKEQDWIRTSAVAREVRTLVGCETLQAGSLGALGKRPSADHWHSVLA